MLHIKKKMMIMLEAPFPLLEIGLDDRHICNSFFCTDICTWGKYLLADKPYIIPQMGKLSYETKIMQIDRK